MFKRLPKEWLALRQDLATIEMPDGEKLTITQGMIGAALYFESKKGNYRLSLQTLVDKFLEFREEEKSERKRKRKRRITP